jgi:tetratricopeptide (TPR) repeat protein
LGLAGAVLVATLILSAATLLLMAANQRERQARQDAEANLKLAKEVVDDCFNVCKDDPLFQQPRMEKVKKLLLTRTLRFYKRMLEQRPADRGLLGEEAAQWFRIGYIQSDLGETSQARTAYEKARERFDELVKAHPDLHEYQSALARTHNNLGLLLQEQGEWQEALKEYEQARDLRLKLVKAHPDLHEYQSALASTHNNRGLLLQEQGEWKEALKEYEQARDLFLKLVEAQPDLHQYQSALASTHYNRGNLLRVQRERKGALREYEQARDLFLKLVKAHPNLHEYQSALASTHNNRGLLLQGQREWKEALKEYEQARDLFLKLVEAHPDLPSYGIDLAGTCCNMGDLLRDNGKATDSLRHFTEAVTLLQAIHQRNLQHATARLFLRNSHWGRAEALAALGRHGEAAADWEQAFRLDTGVNRHFFRLKYADSRARAGDYGRAAAEADKLGRIPSLPAAVLYDLARVQALNARAAGKDDKRPLAEREKRARQYASAALALLERARRTGLFKDPKTIAHMKKDSDLELLRQTEDFRLWLKRLEGGANEP